MGNTQDIWKEFDRVQPSHRSIHQLIAVERITREDGYATAKKVAHYLNASHSEVLKGLKALKRSGYVHTEANCRYRLSGRGVDTVNRVLENRDIVTRFLSDVLGLNRLDVLENACKIEHLLSRQAADHLTALVGILLNETPSSRDLLATLREAVKVCRPGRDCYRCPINCRFAVTTEVLDKADD
jgi:DtxR family transcriptional regulator, Mn-dependent transcriptional regulator